MLHLIFGKFYSYITPLYFYNSAEVFVEKLDTTRISLTPELINQAARIVFLIGGENKANVLKEVLTGDFNPEKLPSQLVIRSGAEVTFFLDEGAAGDLDLDLNV